MPGWPTLSPLLPLRYLRRTIVAPMLWRVEALGDDALAFPDTLHGTRGPQAGPGTAIWDHLYPLQAEVGDDALHAWRLYP